MVKALFHRFFFLFLLYLLDTLCLVCFLQGFSFMPSAGVEFVTTVGSHIPEYVMSGLQMYTNLYHESGLRAKIAMSGSEVKLTIPAPQGPTKLISVT